MKLFCLLTILIVLLFSCQTENDSEILSETGLSEQDSTDTIIKDQFTEINTYNQIAQFIGGHETKMFKGVQNEQFYKDYQNKIIEGWNKTTARNLHNINVWSKQNHIINNDSITLFYPFSGPDFLYANAFFPNAPKYVLIGLENPGKLPAISKMNKEQIVAYLNNLYGSLRYINQAGYFTTKQMQNDFSNSNLNGIIHLVCYYLARTNHKIAKITPIQIDNFGNEHEKKNFETIDNLINGIKFYFFTEDKKFKTLYYFPVDLSDENMKNQFGFVTFISNLGERNTFLKSASYVLHNKEFSIIRNLILKQSKTIIQDDTGVPYRLFSKDDYSIRLFGNYSRTIKMFSNYFQTDLAKALKKNKASKLPFKLGYNSWKDEMVLIVADKKSTAANKPITYKIEKEGVIYKVQIKSSWKKIAMDDPIFKGLPKVDYYHADNLYKYTIGNFSTQEECESYIKVAVAKGFKDAFVVAFYKRNRITLEEAERILKN